MGAGSEAAVAIEVAAIISLEAGQSRTLPRVVTSSPRTRTAAEVAAGFVSITSTRGSCSSTTDLVRDQRSRRMTTEDPDPDLALDPETETGPGSVTRQVLLPAEVAAQALIAPRQKRRRKRRRRNTRKRRRGLQKRRKRIPVLKVRAIRKKKRPTGEWNC